MSKIEVEYEGEILEFETEVDPASIETNEEVKENEWKN